MHIFLHFVHIIRMQHTSTQANSIHWRISSLHIESMAYCAYSAYLSTYYFTYFSASAYCEYCHILHIMHIMYILFFILFYIMHIVHFAYCAYWTYLFAYCLRMPHVMPLAINIHWHILHIGSESMTNSMTYCAYSAYFFLIICMLCKVLHTMHIVLYWPYFTYFAYLSLISGSFVVYSQYPFWSLISMRCQAVKHETFRLISKM